MSIPDGYDGRCATCDQPYAFSNARSGTGEYANPDWSCFCCRSCALASFPHLGVKFPKGTLVHIGGLPFKLASETTLLGRPGNAALAATSAAGANATKDSEKFDGRGASRQDEKSEQRAAEKPAVPSIAALSKERR